MTNFRPPANGASQGNYFLPKSHKLAVFEEKHAYKNSSGSQRRKLFSIGFWFRLMKGQIIFCKITIFSPFCLASPEMIGVKVCHRRTDRKTNSLTPYTGYVDFFFQLNLLPLYLLSMQGNHFQICYQLAHVKPHKEFFKRLRCNCLDW